MKLKVIAVLEAILIAVLAALVAWMQLRPRETAPASVAVVSPETPTEAAGNPEGYRTTGEKLILNDPIIGQMWLPVLEGVAPCSHDVEKNVTRNGRIYYVEDNKITSAVGIDVSEHQGEIDWETVKASGVSFAFIRCGARAYGSGVLLKDSCFERNIAGAEAAGIDVGVYFYSQAITTEEAVEEAEMAISMIGDHKLTYPLVYDWETVITDSARTDDISVDMLTDCTKAFCERVKEAGFTPMVYQNQRTSLLKLELPEIAEYDFWLAEYHPQASYYYDYRIWQFCSDGHVPGIDGTVDINICYQPYTTAS